MSQKQAVREKRRRDERSFIIKYIELYKSLPALWKVKSDDYMNREKKTEAYKILLNLYREKYPMATREDLTKKINSLRTNFRKELRKIAESKNEVYKPTLWYFDAMNFLTDQETPVDSINIKCEEDEKPFIDNFYGKGDTEVSPQPVKKSRSSSSEDTVRDEIIQHTCTRLGEPISDEHHLAISWAAEIKRMNPRQQVFAKKFINDILFEGQMGTLHRNSVIINQLDRTITPLSYVFHSNGSHSES
ncbi:hypothetical protein Trydic_g23368 [Trypoxylus dichotomus]